MGYDFVAIQNSPYKENLETLNMSLARLVLPRLKDAEENVDPNTIIDEIRDMTWEDANQYLNGNSPLLQWVESKCPRCAAVLELSRAAQVRIK